MSVLETKFEELVTKTEKYNVPREELRKMFDHYADLIRKDTSREKTEEQTLQIAVYKTLINVESQYGVPLDEQESSTSDATKQVVKLGLCQLEGFLIGVGTFRDKKADMVKQIKAYVEKEGRKKAKDAGLVNDNGVMLDFRDKVFGRKNMKQGQPLAEANIPKEMSLYGVFRVKGSEQPFTFTTLKTTVDQIAVCWNEVKAPKDLFMPVITWGNVKETAGGYSITPSTTEGKETLFTVDHQAEYDVHEAFVNATYGMTYNIEELFDYYSDNKGDYNRIAFVKGLVGELRPEYANWKGVPTTLYQIDNLDYKIKLCVPLGYEDRVGDGSTIIAYGKVNEIMHKNENTGKWDVPTGKLEMVCIGIKDEPGLSTAPIKTEVNLSAYQRNPFEYK